MSVPQRGSGKLGSVLEERCSSLTALRHVMDVHSLDLMCLAEHLFNILSHFPPQVATPVPLESAQHKVLKVNASQEPSPLTLQCRSPQLGFSLVN